MKENRIALEKGETLMRKKGIRAIHCLEGTLWITGRGKQHDILLCAGDRCALSGFRDVCVQSFSKAALMIEDERSPLH